MGTVTFTMPITTYMPFLELLKKGIIKKEELIEAIRQYVPDDIAVHDFSYSFPEGGKFNNYGHIKFKPAT